MPTKVPNLLINGAAGIAVGMATNIPPHNVGEVIDGVLALIENPKITDEDLIKIIPGPDFPTGGIIQGRVGILSAYKTGRGSISVRGRAHVEEVRKDRPAIVVTELPYAVNKARWIEATAEQVRDKKLEGIADIRDESDRDGMRLVIECKKDAAPRKVLNNLFKHTALKLAYNTNMLALVDGQREGNIGISVLPLHEVVRDPLHRNVPFVLVRSPELQRLRCNGRRRRLRSRCRNGHARVLHQRGVDKRHQRLHVLLLLRRTLRLLAFVVVVALRQN